MPEEELDDSFGFWSTYEQSKCEAERAVWAERNDLPVSVFRLSMVVGDSRTGHTSAFNVLYWPLKMLSRGFFKIVPADPNGVVDVVPVDYVADAIESISSDPANRGSVFTLQRARGFLHRRRCSESGIRSDGVPAARSWSIRRSSLRGPAPGLTRSPGENAASAQKGPRIPALPLVRGPV